MNLFTCSFPNSGFTIKYNVNITQVYHFISQNVYSNGKSVISTLIA